MRNVQLFKSRRLPPREEEAELGERKTKRQVGCEWCEYRWRRGDEEMYEEIDE